MHTKILSFILLLVTLIACADSTAEELVISKTKALMPELQIDEVLPSEIPGLYAITSGGSVVYMSGDGKYLIQGDMYDIQNNKDIVNLTAETRKTGIKHLIDNLKPADLIIYQAPHEKTYITVFTDIDCGYCRELQKEVSALNEAGITVRYAAFPRSEKGTKSYDKAISVWCAKDRKLAYASAMSGADPDPLVCATQPVDAQKAMGEALGISGTPAIIFKNGRLTPGYLPAKQMIEAVYKYGI